MASLQARSPLRSAHLLLFLNKLVSLFALIVLLAAGWMAASFLRAELADRRIVAPDDNALSTSSKPAIPAIVGESESNATTIFYRARRRWPIPDKAVHHKPLTMHGAERRRGARCNFRA